MGNLAVSKERVQNKQHKRGVQILQDSGHPATKSYTLCCYAPLAWRQPQQVQTYVNGIECPEAQVHWGQYKKEDM